MVGLCLKELDSNSLKKNMKNCSLGLLKDKDDISSPISAQLFEFFNSELFPETLQSSGGTSSSNGCCEDNSSYPTTLPLPPEISKFTSNHETATLPLPSDINKFNSNHENNATTATTTSTTTTASNNSNLSIIFDSQEEIDNDISASIGFSPSPPFSVPPFFNPQSEQFDISPIPPQIQITDTVVDGLSQYPPDPAPALIGPPLPSVCEEECLSSIPLPYMRLNPSSPSCSFIEPATMGSYLLGNFTAALSADSCGIFSGGVLMAPELQAQELEYQGDNGGIYCQDSMQRVFNSSELQALSNENQQLVGGGGTTTPLASEMSSLEESTFKVGKLSVEQRKEKIHRYMKKRNERNFSKKIKYACRKTLADSRPRVRGRFAKNDDFGEAPRASGGHHDEDDEEDMGMKEEDELVDSSDILAHISGVNSFKCTFPIQSWI
ncbi:uncharacterized protein LOC100242670 isoform X1 [Vitis vinifera]|uniref:uncharacterized protein LOC100242670 isoform X1 n=1 Tax=Vitis vinifera TaxID=29760 RepID=UPI00053F7447|nr:uncharacterized protein LOC100242670 isoform X1 [Vitis vinifera]|eukprot:XP_010650147.1 PREDICTED: uncharacterized protein LOC100242670 isoform X2 [Vitis vinifera]